MTVTVIVVNAISKFAGLVSSVYIDTLGHPIAQAERFLARRAGAFLDLATQAAVAIAAPHIPGVIEYLEQIFKLPLLDVCPPVLTMPPGTDPILWLAVLTQAARRQARQVARLKATTCSRSDWLTSLTNPPVPEICPLSATPPLVATANVVVPSDFHFWVVFGLALGVIGFTLVLANGFALVLANGMEQQVAQGDEPALEELRERDVLWLQKNTENLQKRALANAISLPTEDDLAGLAGTPGLLQRRVANSWWHLLGH
ncbi:hypothetical protein C8J57DRAFT_1491585 [Mycena rebaudengoi]|nr:hypothetical protein C8J57DRAFT_1491585 [Mycena rebaudengoi]